MLEKGEDQMERRELTKADLDKVRDIEGFPIGTDEDIIALSDAPYYTACPNPFIGDFIAERGHPYDPETDDYHREPYTNDIYEDKHDLIYNVHSYHTKVPPKAIESYIEHYTDPNNIILDVFCGSGMTGIAAQSCKTGKRCAILIDLSPYATFISNNYNTPNSINAIPSLRKIVEELSLCYDFLYKTEHVIDGKQQYGISGKPIEGIINYVIWSDIYYCPHCGHEMVYYDVALDPMTKKTMKKFNCPKCNFSLSKQNLLIKKESKIDESGKLYYQAVKKPVLINYSVGTKRFFKLPDEKDIGKIETISLHEWFPKSELPKGYNTEQPKRSHGVSRVNSFYSNRTLFVLSELFAKIKNNEKGKFLFTSMLPKLTILNRYMPEHGSRALVGPMVGTYYIPSLSVENNVFNQLLFQLQKLERLYYEKGEVCISTQSSTDLKNIPNDSIDYVFIDPPFGANIMYSELNFLPESWLKVHTNNKEEAIINDVQGKGLSDYTTLMTKSLREVVRVLKPKHWVTIEFHNSKNTVWNSIQRSISAAGLIIADVRTLSKEKKTVMQYKSDNTVDQDLVISAYKPDNGLISNMINSLGSEETVWQFVRQHLEMLPVAPLKDGRIEVVSERQAFLLFDRMVAYHVQNGLPVPIDAADFYKGLEERFIQRDGMYFLSGQVNEYDLIRIKHDMEEAVQLGFVVSNEKTAVQWLYLQLAKPQTYATLQPKFMQEVKAVDKYEKIPELAELLEENFLKNDKGEWYIPDITKAGDVAKLREKRLLKEFEDYQKTKGKLKVFRIEAIRAGFKKLWDEKNYAAIVAVADRLPESVIQEDPNLLMYSDLASTRV